MREFHPITMGVGKGAWPPGFLYMIPPMGFSTMPHFVKAFAALVDIKTQG